MLKIKSKSWKEQRKGEKNPTFCSQARDAKFMKTAIFTDMTVSFDNSATVILWAKLQEHTSTEYQT